MAFPVEGGEPWQHGERKTLVQNSDGSVTRRLVNGEYDITLSTPKEGEGGTTVVVKDRAGKELYSGPYMTVKEKDAVPQEYSALVKNLWDTERVSDGGAGPNGTMTRVDAAHRITVSRKGDEMRLRVVEVESGKVIYDGPADSDDAKNLPADVQGKVKALEEKMQLQK